NRVRSLLVVSEVALTLILLAGAGLLTKSFLQLRNVNPGFRAGHLLVLDVVLPKLKYAEKNQIAGFFEQALARIAALPGVESVGATDALPLSGNNISGSFTIEGRPPTRPTGPTRTGARSAPIISARWASRSSKGALSPSRTRPSRNPSSSSTRRWRNVSGRMRR